MFPHVDPGAIRRIVETEASVEEIAEALHLVDDDAVLDDPPTSRVAAVRAILCDLGAACTARGVTSLRI
jgi:hypothetical protein